jgi:methyl-accepting chemotaxis protein
MISIFNKKLANKLSITIVGSVILTFLITGIAVYNSTKTKLVDYIEEEVSLNSQLAVSEISSVFAQTSMITEQLSINQAMMMYLEEVKSTEDITLHPMYAVVLETLFETKESYSLLGGAWVAKYDPSFYVMQNGDISGEEYDITTRPWYSVVDASDNAVFTEPYVSVSDGITYISVIKAVKDREDNNFAVVGVDLELDTIPEIMGKAIIGEKGNAILISASGTYIYTNEESKILNDKATDDPVLKEYVQAALNGEEGIEKIEYNGETYYLDYESMGESGWAVLNLVNEEEMLSVLSGTILQLVLIFLIGCVVLGLIVYILIAKNMKPIVKATDDLKLIAAGDFSLEINDRALARKDEIGDLARALTMILENFNNIINGINSASEQVAAGSRQVSDSSTSLAQGATEQASAVEQLSVSVDVINSQAVDNAKRAEEAKDISQNALVNASEGTGKMQEMLGAMQEINISSNNISKIIKVIDEIAFQTNILALNAAIEAARAGQHGKGFAVVAEEVRSLAGRSAEAAKETTSLIENSIKKVDDGTKLANTTSEALSDIVKKIEKTFQLIEEISVASSEQAVGAEQINKGVAQITDTVQANSATSEETASASEELASQAEVLKMQISKFKLRDNRNTKYDLKVDNDNLEELNPEVLKMLESMKAENLNTEESGSKQKEAKINSIKLSDDEFGKY